MTILPAHPLQITTLAVWLSVGVAAVVGMVVSPSDRRLELSIGDEVGAVLGEIVLGDPFESAGGREEGFSDVLAAEVPAFSEPPELPAMAETEPLPAIPKLRAPTRVVRDSAPARPSTSASGGETASTNAQPPPRPDVSRVTGQPRASSGQGREAAMASRLAAGRMPGPQYPMEARRRGQSGTVVVEFTIGDSGRVISARLKQPSRWPTLNREALRAVRGWKFPAGDVMTLERPIIFQLR